VVGAVVEVAVTVEGVVGVRVVVRSGTVSG
jgi:hypothetical protein